MKSLEHDEIINPCYTKNGSFSQTTLTLSVSLILLRSFQFQKKYLPFICLGGSYRAATVRQGIIGLPAVVAEFTNMNDKTVMADQDFNPILIRISQLKTSKQKDLGEERSVMLNGFLSRQKFDCTPFIQVISA